MYAGYWLEPLEGKGGRFVVFESEQHAKAMVEGIKAHQGSRTRPSRSTRSAFAACSHTRSPAEGG